MATTATTEIKNFINGEEKAAAEGGTEPVINPATGEQIAVTPLSTQFDVDAAVGAAKDAFDAWGLTTPQERSLALLKIADAVEEMGEELSQIESLNVGKPIEAMREEIPVCVDNLRFFAGAARNLEGKATGEYMEGYTSMIRREPVGVVGQVAPWNYPLMMAVWKIGPALATGNTVVLKPSETTPVTTVRLAGKAVYDDVVSGLAERAEALVMGDTLADGTTLGPLNSAPQRERVSGFLA